MSKSYLMEGELLRIENIFSHLNGMNVDALSSALSPISKICLDMISELEYSVFESALRRKELNMNISVEDAKKTLAQADAATESTKVVAALAGTDIVVMTWGLVWFFGYAWSHLVATAELPEILYAMWFALIAIGVLVTVLVERRHSTPVRNPVAKRIGLFWWAMYGYLYCGLLILGPLVDNTLLDAAPDRAKAIAAVNTIIPMFAYVVMGLWLEQRHLLTMGLGLTAVTLAIYFAFNPVFFIAMAIVGGGLLFGYGVWMRVNWHRAVRRLGQSGQV